MSRPRIILFTMALFATVSALAPAPVARAERLIVSGVAGTQMIDQAVSMRAPRNLVDAVVKALGLPVVVLNGVAGLDPATTDGQNLLAGRAAARLEDELGTVISVLAGPVPATLRPLLMQLFPAADWSGPPPLTGGFAISIRGGEGPEAAQLVLTRMVSGPPAPGTDLLGADRKRFGIRIPEPLELLSETVSEVGSRLFRTLVLSGPIPPDRAASAVVDAMRVAGYQPNDLPAGDAYQLEADHDGLFLSVLIIADPSRPGFTNAIMQSEMTGVRR